ncbi:hypothetical protein QVD17_39033 [Tagetes erecta]|uniref:Uncharacterized protein n=1 Tax=Tagetes erecta TaxID=13708 RepID=A0AAD8NFW4_TARER|nr:hypothetical protein QVD17_39033 [Tagetes erecta]
MEQWEEWSTSGGEMVGSFPCVCKISITGCPKLNLVAIELIPSLRGLHVEGCSFAVLRSMAVLSSSIDTLTIDNIKGLTKLHGEVLEHLKAVEDLRISHCASLQSIEEKDVNMAISMKSLAYVKINDCTSLESYSCPNNIAILTIECCPSITSSSFPTMDDLPSTLNDLTISKCDNMEVSWPLNSFLLSLKYLSIDGIPKLRLFPEGCLVNLIELTIENCDNIESIPDNGYGFLPRLCKIKCIPLLSPRRRCDRRIGKYWPIISQIPDHGVY